MTLLLAITRFDVADYVSALFLVYIILIFLNVLSSWIPRMPYNRPLRATLEQLAGLPKALVITDEADVLRDEGEAYGRKLREAGVDVTVTRYEGVVHDFVMVNALRATNGRVFGPSGAAERLGIPRSTLESKIRSLKINKRHFRSTPAKSADKTAKTPEAR